MLNIKFAAADAPPPPTLIPSEKAPEKVDEAKERTQLLGNVKPKSELKPVMQEEPSDSAEVKML